MKFQEVLKRLKKDGWYVVDQVGSHVQLKHPVKKGRVTLQKHGNKDIPIGTLKSIARQSGIELP